MSVLQTVAAAEAASLSTALFGAVGWVVSRTTRRREITDERRDSDDATHTIQLQLLQRDVSEIKDTVGRRLDAQDVRIERIERRNETVTQEVTALSTITERHEQWHERHDPKP